MHSYTVGEDVRVLTPHENSHNRTRPGKIVEVGLDWVKAEYRSGGSQITRKFRIVDGVQVDNVTGLSDRIFPTTQFADRVDAIDAREGLSVKHGIRMDNHNADQGARRVQQALLSLDHMQDVLDGLILKEEDADNPKKVARLHDLTEGVQAARDRVIAEFNRATASIRIIAGVTAVRETESQDPERQAKRLIDLLAELPQ